MFKRPIILLFVLVLLVNISLALDVKTYSNTFNLVNDRTVVETDIIFNQETTASVEFALPLDHSALTLYLDGKNTPYNIENNILHLNLINNSKVSFNYLTQEFNDNENFLINLNLLFNTENLITKLILPERASLKKPIKEGDLTSGSIYPTPERATTDGRSLIFYWLDKDLKKGDEISIFAQVDANKDNNIIFILIAIIIFLLGFFMFKSSKITEKETKVTIQKEDNVEKYLKENEEQIVNILKQKEGSCEQGTIRVITGFSKATLSRLLSELEARKVIYKEKKGKKNLVFLKG